MGHIISGFVRYQCDTLDEFRIIMEQIPNVAEVSVTFSDEGTLVIEAEVTGGAG